MGACLLTAFINLFYEKTVKKLTDEEKINTTVKTCFQQALIDIENMPKTHSALKKWVMMGVKEEYLKMTDVAKDVQDIIAGGPVPKHIKPIWPLFLLQLLTHYKRI